MDRGVDDFGTRHASVSRVSRDFCLFLFFCFCILFSSLSNLLRAASAMVFRNCCCCSPFFFFFSFVSSVGRREIVTLERPTVRRLVDSGNRKKISFGSLQLYCPMPDTEFKEESFILKPLQLKFAQNLFCTSATMRNLRRVVRFFSLFFLFFSVSSFVLDLAF